jgi:hypothetical protein
VDKVELLNEKKKKNKRQQGFARCIYGAYALP